MAYNKEELFRKLEDAVVEMDEDQVAVLANQVVEDGVDAFEAIDQGLAKGMERAGQLFEEEEYFIPELLMCSDAMYAGLDILKPHLKAANIGEKQKVVIGVVEGDTHDIGKNLVKIMLETSGFEITDLGRDVPPARFVDTAKEIKADIIALSTLMTTTMDGMQEVITLLDQQNIRSNYKVIVGGGPISPAFAKRIGADGYAANAAKRSNLPKRCWRNGGSHVRKKHQGRNDLTGTHFHRPAIPETGPGAGGGGYYHRQPGRIFRRQIRAGAHSVCIDPLYSSASILKKETWERFEGPFCKRIADAIRDAGGLVTMHNCGNGVYFDAIIKWLDPVAISHAHPAYGCKTWQEHAEVWGNKVVSMGYSDPATTGLEMTPEEIIEDCRQQIETFSGCNGGYLLSTRGANSRPTVTC